MRTAITEFVRESNAIEGIYRAPTTQELEEAERFLARPQVTLKDLLQFVSVYQPDAKLRDTPGLNVMIGGRVAPFGDITIKTRLLDILADANGMTVSPYQLHVRYELLHPFTDCNGRSGRILWLWKMKQIPFPVAPLGFLQTFYYQTLSSLST